MICRKIYMRLYGPTDVFELPSNVIKSRTSDGDVKEIEAIDVNVYCGYSVSMVNFDMTSELGGSGMPVHKGRLVKVYPYKDMPYEIEIDGKVERYSFIGLLSMDE